VFSPTVASDEKWDYVKAQPLLSQNTKLQNWVKCQEKSNGNKVVEGEPVKNEFEGLVNPYNSEFDGRIPEDCFIDEYHEGTLDKLLGEQMDVIKLLKKHGMSKHLANRILIIFDDLVGSSLFSGTKQNSFKGLNTRHRHYSCSMLMVSQGYKEIPKTIRTNWSCLILFEICNDKEIEVIYEEFPMNLKRNDWLEMYKYATSGDHSFCFFNYQKPRELRKMKNFDEILYFK
jgi:hypothetical protein